MLQVPEKDPARKDLKTGFFATSMVSLMGLATLFNKGSEDGGWARRSAKGAKR